MSVVATSVFLLFALIVLGFILGKRNIIHKERSEGSISRSYRLPNVVANEIHAKYDNGVLTITLPKQTAGDDDNSIQID